MSYCQWPVDCYREIIEGYDYCFDHLKAQGIRIKNPPKEKKPINNRSKKQAGIMKELSLMYPVFLEKYPDCELRLDGCTGKAETIHHLAGRIGDQVFEVKDWMSSCFNCNNAVENNPKALEKGLKRKRNTQIK